MRVIIGPDAEGGDTLYNTSFSSDADLMWVLVDFRKNGLVGNGFSSICSLGITTSIFGLAFGDVSGGIRALRVESR